MAYEELEAIPRGLETPNVYGPADAPLTVQESQLIGSVRKNDRTLTYSTVIDRMFQYNDNTQTFVVDYKNNNAIPFVNAITALKAGATITVYTKVSLRSLRTSISSYIVLSNSSGSNGVFQLDFSAGSIGSFSASLYELGSSTMIFDILSSDAQTGKHIEKRLAIEINPGMGVVKFYAMSHATRKPFLVTPLNMTNLARMPACTSLNSTTIISNGELSFSVYVGQYDPSVFCSRRRLPIIPQQPILPSKVGIPGLIEQSKRPWTSQPQGPVGIDWSNPITKGLDGVVSSSFSDYSISVLPIGVTRIASKSGIGISWPQNSNSARFQNKIFTGSSSSKRTLLYVGNAFTSGTNVGPMVSVNDVNKLQVLSDSLGIRFRIQGSWGQVVSNNIAVTGEFCAVIKATTGDTAYAFLNGNYITSLTGYGWNLTPELVLGFGDSGYPGGYTSSAGSVLVLSWNRLLSDAEIKFISQNPWQIFQPLSYKQFVGKNTLPNNIPLLKSGANTRTLMPNVSDYYKARDARTFMDGGAIIPYNNDYILDYRFGESVKFHGNGAVTYQVYPYKIADYESVVAIAKLRITSLETGKRPLIGTGYFNYGLFRGFQLFVKDTGVLSVSIGNGSAEISADSTLPVPLNKTAKYAVKIVKISNTTPKHDISAWVDGIKYLSFQGDYNKTGASFIKIGGGNSDLYSATSNVYFFDYTTFNGAFSDAAMPSLMQQPVFVKQHDRVQNRTPVKPQPLLPKYNPWTSQPQQAVGIDWGNPITRGLVRAFLPTSGEVIVTPNGVAGLFLDQPLTQSESDALANRGTLLTSLFYKAYPPAWKIVAGVYHYVGTSNQSEIELISSNTTGARRADIRTNTATVFGSNIQVPSLNSPIFTGLKWTDRTGATGTFIEGTATYAMADGAGTWVQEGVSRRVTAGWSGSVYATHLFLWNRALSDAEISSVRQNPWQIFKPIKYPARLK